jgi:ParB family chromosome partitioning protein
MVEARRGLGRGLSALLDEAQSAMTPERRGELGVIELPIELIRPNPDQPRKRFNQTDLDDLAESIRQKGVIQPILVRPHPVAAGEYQIVAGERRWRAAQLAGLRQMPALSRSLTTLEVMEIALIENIQRADLGILEEARAYQAMMEGFNRNAEDIAKVVGKSRSHVANTLRLLRLPEEIRGHLEEGRLTAGHARALLERDDALSLAERVVRKGLNVRQTEALARQGAPSRGPARGRKAKDADTQAVESDLSDVLGMPVEIKDANGSGSLTIRYETLEQLDELCRRLLTRPGRSPSGS